jgi:16S rRNA (guanine966-N2)-methyltransferase
MIESLVDLDGARVADLFAGSGALGIEALSRGAASAVFVDRSAEALRAVRSNLAAVGLEDKAVGIVRDEVLAWLGRSKGTDAAGTDKVPGGAGRFDLVLCDPPYAFRAWGELLGRVDADLAVLESDHPIEVPVGWKVIKNKRYGGTLVTVVRASGTQPSGDSDCGGGVAGHIAGSRTTSETKQRGTP